MPKPRKPEHRSLPARWRFKHGAYYFRVPRGLEAEWDGKQEFRLGSTLAEAYREWAMRLESAEGIRSLGDLFDRYAAEVVPAKAPKTQVSNRLSLRRLRLVFGQVPVSALKPRHAYKFRDEITKRHGAASANRDLEVLSHSLSKAVEWGVLDRNPVKGQVRKNSIPRRERYIEDWEIREALRVASPILRAYIVMKLLTGLRRGDLLRLQLADISDEGIEVRTSKTSVRLLITWTPELRQAVDYANSIRSNAEGPWLFRTEAGACYCKPNGSASAFDSLWRRFMRRLLKETNVKQKFQEKDLRKKTASDMPIDAARKLLGHKSDTTTIRHYRLKAERVAPHSLETETNAT
jgi:integrase